MFAPSRTIDKETSTRAPWRTLAVLDLIVGGYMVCLAVLLWVRSPPPGPGPVIWQVYACIFVLAAAALTGRCVPQIPRWVRLNFYRVVVVGSIVWGYLMLRDILPVVRTDSVDAALAAIDERVFGGQPVLWLEALNRRPIVEWMSFFYFNYYTLHVVHIVGAVWVARSTRIAGEFGIGTAIVYCGGHLGYMAVPAYGPVVFFEDRFHAPLDGALFWGWVSSSVQAGGALKDVFPSLHTGGTMFLALFALRQATLDRRWRIPAAVTAFFTANVVVSTLVLRWHYAVDVMAGIALAAGALYAASRVVPWEDARRRRLGLPPVWPE